MKSLPRSIDNAFPLIFAPIDGITDAPFRSAIDKHFPRWDYFFTDFFRVPSNPSARFSEKIILGHLGDSVYRNQKLRQKTVLQFLVSAHGKKQSGQLAKLVSDMEIPWLDINVGCPSKKVFGHQGGAYLLGDLDNLRAIVQEIRKNYLYFLSAKIRLGINDDANFTEIIKLLQDEGVDLITLHPRTRAQFYNGKSNWQYITQAVQQLNIPVIGNGDVNSTDDIWRMKEETGCYGVMIGRSAVTNPLLAKNYKEKTDQNLTWPQLSLFLDDVKIAYLEQNVEPWQILKRLKLLLKLMGTMIDGQQIYQRLTMKNLIAFENSLK